MNETWDNNQIENQRTAAAIKPEETEAVTSVADVLPESGECDITETYTAVVPEAITQNAQPEQAAQNAGQNAQPEQDVQNAWHQNAWHQNATYPNVQYQNTQQMSQYPNQPNAGQQGGQQVYPQNAYGNPAYQTPAYQNPYYNPYQGYPAGQGAYGYSPYVNPTYQQTLKKKRKSGKFIKFLGTAAAMLLFGLIAGGSFIGVNYLYDYLNPQEPEYVAPPVIGQGAVADNTINDDNRIQSSAVADSAYIQGTSVSDIAEAAMPFTVAINCTFTTDSWFGRYETPGSGSGIIVGKNDSELLIVTNNHVIDGANTIKVTLIDETEAEAVVKGTAASTDLAVVAIQLKDLSQETMGAIKIAELGNSNDIKVGEMVVAIGNALGYGQSVTVGYVSAKDREVTVDNTKMTLLQTDAAINPGNSGGALLNLEGEVIGINSVKYADEDVEGMCFAIPVSNVKDIIENLMNSLAEDEKGYLGVGVNDVTEAIAQYYNWPVGVYVVNFSENSAAEEAGVMIGDIITGVNGVVVETANELIERVTSNRYGTTVTITVQRNVNGEYQEMEFEVVLRQSAEFVEQNETKNTERLPGRQ